jgi:hypothetical protein
MTFIMATVLLSVIDKLGRTGGRSELMPCEQIEAEVGSVERRKTNLQKHSSARKLSCRPA